MNNLNYLPYVLSGDKVYTDQNDLYIIYQGDKLNGADTISNDGGDNNPYGSLNQTSIDLYNNDIALANNDNILLNNINEIQNSLDNSEFLLASADEYITGNWIFESSTLKICNISNRIIFNNSYDVNTIMNQRDDTSGILDYSSTFAPLDIQTNSIALSTVETESPNIIPNYGVLYVDNDVGGSLRFLYPDGSKITIGQKDGVTSSDEIQYSTNDITVTTALDDRPTFDELSISYGSNLIGSAVNNYAQFGSNVYDYLINLTNQIQTSFDNENKWFDVKAISTTNLDLSTTKININSVDVQVGDRVLINAQTDPTENGIYSIGTTSLTRTHDANTTENFSSYKSVFVTSINELYGLQGINSSFELNTNDISFIILDDSNGSAPSAGMQINLTLSDFTLDDDDPDDEYYYSDIVHNLNRSIANPSFIDTDGDYLDLKYTKIDDNSIRIISGEALVGSLILT